MSIDLLIYIVIAAVLVVWLKNTLGTKHGSEIDRSDIIDQIRERQQQVQKSSDPVQFPKDIALPKTPDTSYHILDGLEIEGGQDTIQSLVDFMKIDPSFNPKAFVSGAKDAFPMIVESFAKGDLKTLKMLLSDDVFTAFESAIEDRKTKGETLITDVHAVKNCKIMGIKTVDRIAYIKLRFMAEETILVKDREGHVISGHPDKMITMNDVWTFGRNTRSKDPTWYLYETSDDVIEDFKNPIPDTK